ncbi:MAG: tRNA (adenosine(37)-N6)-threonylcarbamoyltransferase complex ATPase subunit type 1 TsaE [Mollicutes bacterium]|nr:MAG: tRNA (adenosine(37)-N6)-threonylcarbamoyltransferase complex ATPase subunit type 1 TsaE [Mollicutes bacterium]
MLSIYQLIVKDLSTFQSLTYRLAKLLPTPLIICLSGNLGTGKTQFVKFFAEKLGITSSVISPTFVKLLRYKFSDG